MTTFYEAVIKQTTASNASCFVAELDKTVSIPLKFLNNAFHGDKVLVKVKEGEDYGFVQKVLERTRATLTGQLQLGEKYAFVRPWSNHFFRDFYIPLTALGGAKDGDVVEITGLDWAKKNRNPGAVVGKVLLHVTPAQYQMYRFGLPTKFTDRVLEEVKALNTEVVASAERIDLTHLNAFTIDPDNCADRDDALSIEHLAGGYRIGVHIADVTHYVKAGSEIDREAYHRGNSLYLTNQVVPMLPERLSSDLCSLSENEDRYCLTLFVQVNAQFELVERYVCRTLIRSRKAFTYGEAELAKQDPDSPHYADLNLLDVIGTRLRKRLLPAEMSFTTPHTLWDTRSGELKLRVVPNLSTNRLVQAWMLVANHFVSILVARNGAALYRVHKPMDETKLDPLKKKLAQLRFAWDDTLSVNANLRRAHQPGDNHLVGELISRSFRSAYYSPEASGHYAIGTAHYTHFTSPIRRYADVVVHRILNNLLDAKETHSVDMEKMCKHLSGCEKKGERIATETEQLNAIAFIKGVKYDMESQVINQTRNGILVKTDLYINAWVDKDDLDATWNEELQQWEGKVLHYIGERLVVRLKDINYKTNQIHVKIC